MIIKYIGVQENILHFISDKLLKLKTGINYELKAYDEHTEQQRKTFHKLVNILLYSGCNKWNETDYEELKKKIKFYCGAGFSSVVYFNKVLNQMTEEKNIAKFNKDIKPFLDPKRESFGVLKRWRDYTKEESTNAIKNLCSEMIQSGVFETHYGKEFSEILETIGSEI